MTSAPAASDQTLSSRRLKCAEVDRIGRQQARKRLRIGALRIEQPDASRSTVPSISVMSSVLSAGAERSGITR